MRHYLLPVWGASRFASTAQDVGAGPADWLDAAPLDYPHALISYLHWQQPFAFPHDAYIFGDSGGFALRAAAARARHLDAIDVLHWQAALCTVGCILDVPPKGGAAALTLDATTHHLRQALPHYRQLRQDGHRFRWWGVLHGNNEREVTEYYEAVAKVYPFADAGEGWAIRAEPQVNADSVARSLRVLRRLNIRRVHFLAATGQDVIAVLLALGPQAGIELLTYDSAYAIKCGFNRHIFAPRDDGLTFGSVRERGDSREGRALLERCPCMVCGYMRQRAVTVPKARYELQRGTFGGWWSTWAQLHNVRVQVECTRALAREASSQPDLLLRTMLRAEDYSRVVSIFEEEGHEAAG